MTEADRRIDLQLAHALGVQRISKINLTLEVRSKKPRPADYVGAFPGVDYLAPIPYYSEDLQEMHQVETYLAQRGLQAQYLKFLLSDLAAPPRSLKEWFVVVHATAQQRAIAALRTLVSNRAN